MNDYRNYYLPSSRFQRHHAMSGMMPECGLNRHTTNHDPIIDEAVKSILQE